jgi:hypothetical protein
MLTFRFMPSMEAATRARALNNPTMRTTRLGAILLDTVCDTSGLSFFRRAAISGSEIFLSVEAIILCPLASGVSMARMRRSVTSLTSTTLTTIFGTARKLPSSSIRRRSKLEET